MTSKADLSPRTIRPLLASTSHPSSTETLISFSGGIPPDTTEANFRSYSSPLRTRCSRAFRLIKNLPPVLFCRRPYRCRYCFRCFYKPRHSFHSPIDDNVRPNGSTSRCLDSSPKMQPSIFESHANECIDDTDEIRASTKFGIPQHYGLFYAMGLALTMEGVLSACYHICPSFSNFQFDTAYMYILALILMLKIYQTRHPDINASAHAAYMVMAVIILLGVTGVLYGGETFWVLFTVTFLIMSIWITAEVYYMGQWSFDICLPRRLYYLMRSDGIQCLTPMYLERMLLLLTANCVNIGMATYGIFTRPNDFSSFLLSIFMINLLMYYCFYIIMKLRHHEHLLCVPLIYIILSCVTWGSAIYFFIQHSTTWEVSPAQSRALNRPCLMLDFYDDHDVWHFLSSTSMFFSFMSIMTLDDDLVKTPRNEIPVF